MGISGGQSTFAFGAGVIKVIGDWCPITRNTVQYGIASVTLPANTFALSNFVPAFSFGSDQVSCNVSLAAAAGSLARVAVFTSLGTALPYQLIASSAEFLVDTGGVKVAALSSIANFVQGFNYWVGVISNGAPKFGAVYATDFSDPSNDIASSVNDIRNAHAYATPNPNIWPYGVGNQAIASPFPIQFKFHIAS